MLFWAIWHLFQKNRSKNGTVPTKNWNPKIGCKLVKISKKRHNIIIVSHIKVILVSIPMILISRNWLKVSKILETSYKGGPTFVVLWSKFFAKKTITVLFESIIGGFGIPLFQRVRNWLTMFKVIRTPYTHHTLKTDRTIWCTLNSCRAYGSSVIY